MAKFKVVTPKGTSFAVGRAAAMNIENEALTPLDAEIVEIDGSSENSFIDGGARRRCGLCQGHEIHQAHDRRLAEAARSSRSAPSARTTSTSPPRPRKGIPGHQRARHLHRGSRRSRHDAAAVVLASLVVQDRMVRDGRWKEGRPALNQPRLMGRTLGFIAFGHVARAVAMRAKAFGFHMMAYRSVHRGTGDEPVWRRAGDA